MAWTEPPVKVAPLIKLSRWSLLISGIVWGANKKYFLHNKREAERTEEARLKPMKDAKIAAEKKAAYEAELRELAKMAEDWVKKK